MLKDGSVYELIENGSDIAKLFSGLLSTSLGLV